MVSQNIKLLTCTALTCTAKADFMLLKKNTKYVITVDPINKEYYNVRIGDKIFLYHASRFKDLE